MARLPAYAELHAWSNFTFLEGASHPDELAEAAARMGLAGMALTDRDGLYGAVRFASKVGQLAGNHFITITDGLENLATLGRSVLWHGAHTIRFELA